MESANNYNKGLVSEILDKYEEGTSLEESARLLLEQALHNNGDLTFIDVDLATKVLELAGVETAPESSEQADLLMTLTFGQRAKLGISKSGTFSSFKRVAKWEDPKWISGNRAWKENSRKIYTKEGELLDDTKLQEIRNGFRESEESSTLVMKVGWDFIPSPNQVDVLRWAEHVEAVDGEDEYTVYHRTVYIHGIPVHDYLEQEGQYKHSLVVPEALRHCKVYDHRHRSALLYDPRNEEIYWSDPRRKTH